MSRLQIGKVGIAMGGRPKAITDGFSVEEAEGGVVVFELAENRVHRLSRETEMVWEVCDGERTIEDIAAHVGLGRPQVVSAIAQLTESGLVDFSGGHEGNGRSTRRSILRRTAVGGVVAATGTSLISGMASGASTAAGVCTTGESSASDFAATGLAGATAASRYAGATSGGPPNSGSFATGDYVIDQNGLVWVCTNGGSPGNWTPVGGGPAGVVNGNPGPVANNLLAWTFDPQFLVTQNRAGAGRIMFAKFYLPIRVTINAMYVNITTGGAGLSNCYLGLYSSSGSLVGVSSDQSSSWANVSTASGPAAVPLNAQPGQSLTQGGSPGSFVLGAYLIGGATTVPKYLCAGVTGNAECFNVGLSHSGASDCWRYFTSITGTNTSLPSTFNLYPASGHVTDASCDSIWLALG